MSVCLGCFCVLDAFTNVLDNPLLHPEQNYPFKAFLTVCRKEAASNSHFPLTGPHGLEGASLSHRLGASRNYKHPVLFMVFEGSVFYISHRFP